MISLKRLKKHWTAGPLAGLLSAALALPTLLAWLPALAWLLAAPQPARAQTLNRLPTWAVVNFVNHSGYSSNDVGIEASDGFVVELGKSNKYDVLPRAQTQQTIRDLGLVEPLDTIGLQKLARSLEADAVASGEVASVHFSDSPRRATVTLIIRVVDRLSGELINGAIAQGTSTPRPIQTNDDDSLVNQAIENADFAAVKQISRFNLARATVLIHSDLERVTVNKGTQNGLFDGLNMLVTRNGTEVGRIRIARASADESEAVVTDQGLGIQEQDVATAIYQLPEYSIGPNNTIQVAGYNTHTDVSSDSSPIHHFNSGLVGLVAAIGAALGLAALAGNGHGTTSSGGNAVGGGQLGGQSAALTFNSINDLTPPVENPVVQGSFIPEAVKITFNNGNIDGSQIVEYHVYRDPEPAVLASGVDFRVPTLITAEIGALPIISPADPFASFDSIQDVGPIFVQKPDPTNNTNAPISGNFYQSNNPAGGTTTGQFPISGTGLLLGIASATALRRFTRSPFSPTPRPARLQVRPPARLRVRPPARLQVRPPLR